MKTAIDKKKIIRILLWVFIAAGFLFTRLFRLDVLPGGLHIDEAGAAYDAWSLANFGVDRYRNAWPVYLTNYGDGQSIMLAYLGALLMKLNGGAYNVWCIRLPETLFSALTLIFGIKLAREMFGKETLYPELTGIMLVFSPYLIMMCRFGYDCNLMLGAATVFLYFFTMGAKTLSTKYYVLAGISGGLMLYTYAISHLILPIFLLIAAIYMMVIRQFRIRKWLIAGASILPFATPLIYFHIVNYFNLPQTKLFGFTITRLKLYRITYFSRPSLHYFLEIFKNVFIGGKWAFDCVKGYPPLTYAAIPLCTIGFVYSLVRFVKQIGKKQFSPYFPIIVWPVITFGIFMCVHSETYRANFVFSSLVLLEVVAVFALFSSFKTLRQKIPANTSAVLLILSFCVQAAMFSKYYFTEYSKDYPCPNMFGNAVGKACNYVLNDEYLSSRTTRTSQSVMYYLLDGNVSPFACDFKSPEIATVNGILHNSIKPVEKPEDDCNYIVGKGIYQSFQGKLILLGFTAVEFPECVLYYK